MFFLFFIGILAISFNFLILVNDESFLLFVFLSFYYLIVALSMRLTIKSFIFIKIWKIYDIYKNLHWINIYIEFLNSAFFLYLKKLLKPIIISKKLLLNKTFNSITFLFNNNFLYTYIKIEEAFSRSLKYKNFLFNILSTFINVDKILIINKILIK